MQYEGRPIPQVRFRIRDDDGWSTLSTDELFGGKTVIAFSLPGAFTPTCSSMHLPRYNELAPVFKANGVDAIVCIAVNDPFVMAEWAKDQACGNVIMLPDGNAEFTESMGMLVDKSDLGLGKRAWRYSMLVKDRIVQKMFIEPDKPGDPFEASDADTMLRHINPAAQLPDQVAIFTRDGCAYCTKAKQLLQQLGIDYAEVPLPHSVRGRVVGAVTGKSTVPQVFVNGKHIGGLEELQQWADQAARA